MEITEVRHIHPHIKKIWRFSALLSGVVMALIFGGVGFAIGKGVDFDPWLMALLGAAVGFCLGGMSLLFAEKQWSNWTYQLCEHELVLTWGVFYRTRRCVARDRIQHVDIDSGPLDRRFGLVQVSIYTAGMMGSVATIPGLTPEDAEFLRSKLLDTRAEHA